MGIAAALAELDGIELPEDVIDDEFEIMEVEVVADEPEEDEDAEGAPEEEQ